MPDRTEPPQNTFVVRFWWEQQGEDAEQTIGWRGRIEHVQSGERMAFRDVRELLAFIARFVAPLWSPSRKGMQVIGEEEVRDER